MSAIARHLNRDRKTVRAYLNGEREPGKRSPAGPDRFERFAGYCRIWFADDPHLWPTALFDEVGELGYDGSYPSFTRALRARGLRLRCEDCASAGVPEEFAVISHPAGGETQWDWVELPGSVHDKEAEWIWGVMAELEKAGLIALADKGYQGSTWVNVPYKGRNKPGPQKEANRAQARLRGPGERANAQLKTWRILRKLRCCPRYAGKLAKAIHVLQLKEAQAAG